MTKSHHSCKECSDPKHNEYINHINILKKYIKNSKNKTNIGYFEHRIKRIDTLL